MSGPNDLGGMVQSGVPQSGNNIFNQSANAYQQGTMGLQSAAHPLAMRFTMNQFADPYRQAVIDNAVRRLRDRRAQDLNMVQGQAAQASAFGGARHGLVESQLMDQYNRNEDEMVSRLLQEGFTTQADLASRALGQQTAASQALVGAAPTGFNLGQGAIQQQAQAGQQQQNLNQAILGQADAQYQGYVNYPNTALGTALAGLQGNPLAAQTTSTQRFNPGLFNYMQLGGGMYAAGK